MRNRPTRQDHSSAQTEMELWPAEGSGRLIAQNDDCPFASQATRPTPSVFRVADRFSRMRVQTAQHGAAKVGAITEFSSEPKPAADDGA